MKTPPVYNIPRPPGIFRTIRAGFDAVSTHLRILILPIIIDVWLWLGPQATAPQLFQTLLADLEKTARQAQFPADLIDQSFKLWQDILPRINFFAAVRTFPVGVPGLMWMRLPEKTPLASRIVWELTDWGHVFLLIMGVSLAGWALGAVFFNMAAWRGNPVPAADIPQRSFWYKLFHSLLLMLIWQGIIMLVGGGILMISSLFFLINPALGQTIGFLGLLAATWLVVPIFFSPHGIFLYGYNAIETLQKVFKFTRYGLHFNSMFTFTLLMLAYFSASIWNIPQDNSWLLLVGIVGHAFVTSALMTASFIYYRKMQSWQNILLMHMRMAQEQASSQD